ncbi:MAG: autotransporter-associated beta strand repeat-containing protein [Bacteroidales bacterium]|nr:autotransporter-associated beta strand repeat-containing protein [Bacteroidales bacterium]
MKNSKFFLSTLFAAAALVVAPNVPTMASVVTNSGIVTGSATWDNDTDGYTEIYTDANALKTAFQGTNWWFQQATYSGNYIIGGTTEAESNLGIVITDGSAWSNYPVFSGTITGTGVWAVLSASSANSYEIFSGDLSGFSGTYYVNVNASGRGIIITNYTSTGSGAATAISGTGTIYSNGTVNYNTSGYNGTAVVNNTTITVATLAFSGSANYTVNSQLIGLNNTTSTLTFNGTGTTTLNGGISNFYSVTVASGTTLVLAGDVALSEGAIQNSGTVRVSSDVVFALDDAAATSSGQTYTYTLIEGGTISNFDTNTLSVANFTIDGAAISARNTVTIGTGTISVEFVSDGYDLLWNGGESGTWKIATDATDGLGDWLHDGEDDVFFGSEDVEFATAGAEITVADSMRVGTLTISQDVEFIADSGVSISAASVDIASGSTLSIGDNVTLSLRDEASTDFSGIVGTGTIAYTNNSSGYTSIILNSDFAGTLEYTGNLDWSSSSLNAANATISVDSGELYGSSSAIIPSTMILGDVTFIMDDASLELSGVLKATKITIESGSNMLTLSGGTGSGSIGTVVLNSVTSSLTFSGASGTTYKLDALQTRVTKSESRNVTIDSGVTVTLRAISNSYGLSSLLVNGTLNVTGAMTYASGSISNLVSGSGTINTAELDVGNSGTYTISVNRMNIGDGGIAFSSAWDGDSDGGHTLSFNGTTIGVTESSSGWTTSSALTISGATFDVDSGKSISINGTVTFEGSLAKTGDGSLSFSSGISPTALSVSGGTLTISGALSSSGSVDVSGGTLTISGDISASKLSLSSDGAISVSGSYSVTNFDIGAVGYTENDAGEEVATPASLTIASGKYLGETLTKSGVGTLTIDGTNSITGSVAVSGGTTNITGTLTASSISVAGDGTALYVSTLGAVSSSEKISIGSGSTLSVDTTSSAISSLSVELDGGTLVGLDIKTGVSVEIDSDSILSGVSITGGTLVIDDGAVVSLVGDVAVSSGTIDLSKIVFDADDAVVIFDVSDLTSSAGLLLESLSSDITTSVEGTYNDNGEGQITFKATEGLWISWDSSSSSKTWTSGKFGDDSVETATKSTNFGILGDGETETITVSGAVSAVNAQVSAGAGSGSYVFTGSGNLTLSGTLTVKSGSMSVGIAMTSSNIVVSGGTLSGTASGSLNLADSSEGSIRISDGTVSLENASATNAETITMTGGELAFVSGALDSVSEISISGTSTNTLTWLGGNTDNSVFSKLVVTPGSDVELDIESGVVTLSNLGVIDVSGVSVNYYKTGAGELQFADRGLLSGTLYVNEGTVSITITSDTQTSFLGDIIISGPTAVFRVENNEPFGGAASYKEGVYSVVSIYDGGTLQVGSSSSATNVSRVVIYDVLTLGDGASIIDDQSYTGSDENIQWAALVMDMNTNASIWVEDGATASIGTFISLETDTTFYVGDGATLTVTGAIVYDDDSSEYAMAGIVKTGTGTLVVSGSNSSSYYDNYGGTTDIAAGTLRIASSGAAPSGSVLIEEGATLEVQIGSSSTATFSGAVSGSGEVHLISGTTVFAGSLSYTGLTTVDESATMLIRNSFSGDIYLAGKLGGSSTYNGSLTLTDTAEIYVETGRTFVLGVYATLTDESSKTVTKTGDGTANISATNFRAETYVVKAGTLSAGTAISVENVELSGGTLASEIGVSDVWTINNLTVDSAGGEISGSAVLVGTAGVSTIDLEGVLTVSGNLSTDDTLELSGSSKSGELAIAAGGSVTAPTLVVGSDFAGYKNGIDIATDGTLTVTNGATFANEMTISGSGMFSAAGTLSFQNGGTISGVTIALDESTPLVFDVAQGATLVISTDAEFAEITDDGLVNPTEATVISKTGAGRLTINTSLAAYFGSIVVTEGTLTVKTSEIMLSNTKDISVDSATLTLSSNSTYGMTKWNGSVSLTNDAIVSGSGIKIAGSANFTALDSSIRASVQLSGSGDIVLGGVTISGGLLLGLANMGVDDDGNAVIMADNSGANLIFDGSTSAVVVEGTLQLDGFDESTGKSYDLAEDATDNRQISVDIENVGAIGSEYVLISMGDSGKNYLTDSALEHFVLSDSVATLLGNRTYAFEVNGDGSLVIKAYGTKVWDGATEWVAGGTGWDVTVSKNSSATASTFETGDYVDFQFSGTGNSITVSEDGVSVGGVAFNGSNGSSEFTVTFSSESGITGDEYSAVSVRSGTVKFEAVSGVEGVDHTFAGGLVIASDASLEIGTLVSDDYRLGTGDITLAGTLLLTQDGSVISNHVAVSGSHATISVATDTAASITGAVSGTGTLNKTGDGELSIIADAATVASVAVGEGTLNIVAAPSDSGDNSGDGGDDGTEEAASVGVQISSISVASGATLNIESGVALTGDTSLAVSGTATIADSGSVLNSLSMTDGATLTVDDGAGTLSVGSFDPDAGVSASYSASGNAQINAGLELDSASSLAISVESGGVLTIAGEVYDKPADDDSDEDSGTSFTITKSGSGTLAFDDFQSAAGIIFSGGTLTFAAGSNASGDFNSNGVNANLIFSVSTEEETSIGDTGKAFVVYSTLNISTTLADGETADDETLASVEIRSNINAQGKINITTEAGTTVVIAGETNAYSEIDVSRNSTLSIAEGVSSFAGTAFVLNDGATLEIGSDLAGTSSGALTIYDGTTISFTSSGASIAFGELSGANKAASYAIAVEGDGRLVIGSGYSAINNLQNLTVTIDDSSTLENAGLMKAGTFVGGGTVANSGTLHIASNSSRFTGTLEVESGGETYLEDGGLIANATALVDSDENGYGTLYLTASGDVSIGDTGDSSVTEVIKSVSGGGRVVALGSSLWFGSGAFSDFTGSLEAIGGTLNYNSAVEAGKIVVGGEYDGVSYGGVLSSIVTATISADLVVSSGEINVASGKTLTVAGAFSASDVIYFTGDGTTDVKSDIEKTSSSLEISVSAGTVKLAGDNQQTLTSVYTGGTVEFDSAASLGTDGSTIVLSGGTVRFADDTDGETISNSISGTGTIEGATGVTLSGISSAFSGTVMAVDEATFTVVCDGDISYALVYFGAEIGSTIIISTAGADDDDLYDGGAYFTGAGTVKLDIGDGKNLKISNSSLYASGSGIEAFTGEIDVTSGTLEIGSSAYLGTGDIVLSEGTTLLLSDNTTLANGVSGYGEVRKTKAGTTSFLGGTLAATTTVEEGTLAISGVASGTSITLKAGASAILELSKVWDASSSSIKNNTSTKTFNADYTISGSGSVTFSYAASTGSATVSGSLTGETANTSITLSGGGEGSHFSLAITQASVTKTGSGNWILDNYSSTADISVAAGVLSIATYNSVEARSEQNIYISSGAYLQISGVSGGDSVRGSISGSGTLIISAPTLVELDLNEDSGDAWKLMVDSGAKVQINDSMANGITVNANGELIVFADSGETVELSGSIDAATNSTVSKTGSGELVISSENVSISATLAIEEGQVTVKTTLGSSYDGIVDISDGAKLVFDLGDDGSSLFAKTLTGEGEMEVASGTVSVLAENTDFSGNVTIDDGATVVLGGGGVEAGFGNGSVTINDGGTLQISQGKDNALPSSVSGSGNIIINNTKSSYTTTYTPLKDFTGRIEVWRGALVVSTENWNSLSNYIVLDNTTSDASLVITNSESSAFSLENRDDNSGDSYVTVASVKDETAKTTVSPAVVLEGAGGFYVASGAEFGIAGSTLQPASGTTLGLGKGATISSDLYVPSGATLELDVASASSVGALSGKISTVALATAAATSSTNSATVNGSFTLDGDMNAAVSDTDFASTTGLLKVADNVSLNAGGLVTLKDEDGLFDAGEELVLVSSGKAVIGYGASFYTADGVELEAVVANDGKDVVVAKTVQVGAPAGLGEFANLIGKNSKIGNAIWGSGTNSEQRAKLLNFSPVSFGALSEMTLGLVHMESDLLRQRLEQRRYDIGFNENNDDDLTKTYVNAVGGSDSTSKGKNKARNYNISHLGALAGIDGKPATDLTIGASIAYDNVQARIHNGGGKHTADAARVGVYGMYMLDEVTYAGLGLNVGFTSFNTKRHNALETLKGDTTGTDISASLVVGRMFVLNEDVGLHISPYIGLDFTYDSIGDFNESGGSESAFDVDSMNRISMRGLVGFTINWVPTESFRLALEFMYAHEFLDTDTDIDAKFSRGEYAGQGFTSTAYFSGENTIDFGPRVEYRINDAWSVSAGYTFQTDFSNTITHNANVGVRYQF